MGKVQALRFVLAALAVVVLAGCHEVVTKQPLPQAKLSAEEQARFAGTWVLKLGDEGATYMVAFDCAGAVHLAAMDWDGRQFTSEQAVVVIARGKHSDADSGFLSVPDDDKGKPASYGLMRYGFVSADDLLLWWPDPAPFDAAIKAGRLKGKSGEHATELTASPQEVLDFLDDPANPPLFAYDKPLLLHRATGVMRHAPCAK